MRRVFLILLGALIMTAIASPAVADVFPYEVHRTVLDNQLKVLLIPMPFRSVRQFAPRAWSLIVKLQFSRCRPACVLSRMVVELNEKSSSSASSSEMPATLLCTSQLVNVTVAEAALLA